MLIKKYLPLLPVPFIFILLLQLLTKEAQKITYDSQEEAAEACKLWKHKGGVWEIKVKETGFSIGEKPSTKTALPIKIKRTNPIPKIDPSYRPEEDKLTLNLPLLTTGKKPFDDSNHNLIKSTADQWTRYDRRNCRPGLLSDQVVLGEEYAVKESERVEGYKMPVLNIRKAFPFREGL